MTNASHIVLPEWITLATTMIDTQQFSDLQATALATLRMALPHYDVDLQWSFQGHPQDVHDGVVHPIAAEEVYGWLTIRPGSLTTEELAILNVIERLIIAAYDRVRQRMDRQDWRRRLQVEFDALRDCHDPELICRQFGQLMSQIAGWPLHVGVAIPFQRSVWIEQIAHYDPQAGNHSLSGRQFWTAETDLSSVVMKLSMPISSTRYLHDCAHYQVRPHTIWKDFAPTYWSGVPIRFEGETIGMVYTYTMTPSTVGELQQQIVNEGLYLISQLLRPILLHREAERASRQQRMWQELISAGVQIFDPDRALQMMLEISCQLLDVQAGSLFIVDEQQREVVLRYVAGQHMRQLVGMRLPMSHGILGQSLALGKPVIVNDAVGDPRRSHWLDQMTGLMCHNLISVPFTSPSGVRACLQYVNRQETAPFIDADIDRINAIMASMSLVIDHAQRLTQVETGIIQHARDLDRRNADLQSVLALSRDLLLERAPDQLFHLIINAICERIRFQAAALFVHRRERSLHPALECVVATDRLAAEFPIGLRLAANRLDILAHEWSLGESCFLLNRRRASFAALFDLPAPVPEQLVDFGATQWNADDLLVVLLRAPDQRVQAVLFLDQPLNGQRPSSDDIQALIVYAGIAGAAIEIALLRHRQQRSLERLTALNGLGMVINSQSLPEPQVLAMTMRGMLEMVDGNWAQVVLFDPVQDTLRFDQSVGVTILSQDAVLALARRALTQRRPVFRSATTVALPLRGTQQPIGVIVIGGEQALDSTDIEMLMLYVTQTAIAIESMRLLEVVRRARDNLSRVMATIEDALILYNADGTVVVTNETFYRLAQTNAWSPPLFQANTIHIEQLLTQWADQRRLEADAIATLCRSLSTAGAQGELRGSDGVFSWKITSAGDLISGRIPAFLLTIRDVTEAKRVEQLREDLTHTLVHDFKNPLTVIKLSFERLEQELGDLLTERQKKAIFIGQNSTNRLINQVRLMLDIGRLESGQMPLELGPLPVASLIEQVTERLSIQAQEKHVQIVHRIDPQVRWLFADADIIARVLQNLLDNALKYSASGDLISLEIQVKPEQQEPQLVTVSDEVTVLIPGDRVAHIVVRDQGPGIPPEAQDALFTRFSQARSKRSEGSGLGLFFCRLAVEAHRGVIWVESSPGQGSAFHFTLPLAEIYSDAG